MVDGLLPHEMGHATITEHREHAIVIVRFDDFANLSDSSVVLVALAHVMKATFHALVTVRPGVVDRDGQLHLPTTAQVVNKRRVGHWLLGDLRYCLRLDVDISAASQFALENLVLSTHHLAESALE